METGAGRAAAARATTNRSAINRLGRRQHTAHTAHSEGAGKRARDRQGEREAVNITDDWLKNWDVRGGEENGVVTQKIQTNGALTKRSSAQPS